MKPLSKLKMSLSKLKYIFAAVLTLFGMKLIWIGHLFGSNYGSSVNSKNQNSNLNNINTNIISSISNSNLTNSEFKESDILSDKNIAMNNHLLVDAVRKLLIPPSTLPYNFIRTTMYFQRSFNPSAGQTQAVTDILKSFGPDGFYVECGANDGEWHTNTWWLERTLGWRGLLIEADPRAFSELQQKHRNAWTGHFCLSNVPFPSKLPFYETKNPDGIMSGLIKHNRTYTETETPTMIQCIPLYTALLAIRRTTIDYFSLDVEGSEIEVLKTVPFDRVIFKVITIEYIGIKEGKAGLVKFMTSKGYILYRIIEETSLLATDCIFIHKSVAARLTPKQNMTIGRHDRFNLADINVFN